MGVNRVNHSGAGVAGELGDNMGVNALLEEASDPSVAEHVLTESLAELFIKASKATLHSRGRPRFPSGVSEDVTALVTSGDDSFSSWSEIEDARLPFPLGVECGQDTTVIVEIEMDVPKGPKLLRSSSGIPAHDQKIAEAFVFDGPQYRLHFLQGCELDALGLRRPAHSGDWIRIDPPLGVSPSVCSLDRGDSGSLRLAPLVGPESNNARGELHWIECGGRVAIRFEIIEKVLEVVLVPSNRGW